jgi:hypothetical protein
MKELTGRVAEADPAKARPILLELSRRQGAREQAWFGMTGFPKKPGNLATLLA